jgi:hypothetical protein
MRNFLDYWRRFFVQFGSECYHTWRAELLSTVAVAVVTYILTHSSDTQARASLKTALLSVGIVLGFFALYHLLRTPWLLDKDRVVKHGHESAQLKGEHLSKLDAVTEELRKVERELAEYLDSNDAPELMLQWQWEPQIHSGPILPRRFLWLENRSTSEDVFNVQAEPAFLTDRVVAHFKAIAVLSHGSKVKLAVHLKQSPADPAHPLFIGHDDEFEFVIFGSTGQLKDLPEENYHVDSNQCEHVRVPIYVTFKRYNGKGYRSKFVFDMNTATHEDVVQFIEVRTLKPLS